MRWTQKNTRLSSFRYGSCRNFRWPGPPPFTACIVHARRSSFIAWRVAYGWALRNVFRARIHDSRTNGATKQLVLRFFFSAAGFNVYNLCILFISYITHACMVRTSSSGNSIASLGEKISFEYYIIFLIFRFFRSSYVCVCVLLFSRAFSLRQIDWSNAKAIQKRREGEHSMAKV